MPPEAEPAAGQADQGAGLGARHLLEHDGSVADRLVQHDVGRLERLGQDRAR